MPLKKKKKLIVVDYSSTYKFNIIENATLKWYLFFQLTEVCVCDYVCDSDQQQVKYCFSFTPVTRNRPINRKVPRDICRLLNDLCAVQNRVKSHKVMFPGSNTIKDCRKEGYYYF